MKYSLTYITAAILAYTALSFAKPLAQAPVRGVLLPLTKHSLSPIPKGKVHSYLMGTYPITMGSLKVARINMELHTKNPSHADINRLLDKATALAAKAGANTLVYRTAYSPDNTNYGELGMIIFQAYALSTGTTGNS